MVGPVQPAGSVVIGQDYGPTPGAYFQCCQGHTDPWPVSLDLNPF